MYANTRNHLVQAMIEELTQEEVSRFLECSADTQTLPNGWPRHQDWHGTAVTDAAAQASEPGASEPTPVTPTEAGTPAGSVQATSEALRTTAHLKEEAQKLFAKIREVGEAVKEGQSLRENADWFDQYLRENPLPEVPTPRAGDKPDAPPEETAPAVAAAKTAKTSPSEEYSYTSATPTSPAEPEPGPKPTRPAPKPLAETTPKAPQA